MNRMPVLFIGHGSPMNAIEQNSFTNKWETIADKFEKPKAIISISAHWYTSGTRISDAEKPRMIYDMYGFPDELYAIKYPVDGSPELAKKVKELIGDSVIIDNSWGIDHGTWSVLRRVYPRANIPVIQLSINYDLPAEEHYKIGKSLESLRDEGVLIMGSGNIVHHFGLIDWRLENVGSKVSKEFDGYIKKSILAEDVNSVINYRNAGSSADKAFQTPDHYYPLLYALGAAGKDYELEIFCEGFNYGALSMTSYIFR